MHPADYALSELSVFSMIAATCSRSRAKEATFQAVDHLIPILEEVHKPAP